MPTPVLAPSRRRLAFRPGAAFALLTTLFALTGSGCGYFRTLGSGTHLDATQGREVHATHESHRMIVDITTDAQGQISDVRFKRSSGKEGIDAYVVETIREGWPQQPSTRTEVEVTFTSEKGFSQPKVLATGPAA